MTAVAVVLMVMVTGCEFGELPDTIERVNPCANRDDGPLSFAPVELRADSIYSGAVHGEGNETVAVCSVHMGIGSGDAEPTAPFAQVRFTRAPATQRQEFDRAFTRTDGAVTEYHDNVRWLGTGAAYGRRPYAGTFRGDQLVVLFEHAGKQYSLTVRADPRAGVTALRAVAKRWLGRVQSRLAQVSASG